MPKSNCPGQDMRFWKPEDIFEAPCPHCGIAMEFWKDDMKRKCRSCGKFARNPRLDLGCAECASMPRSASAFRKSLNSGLKTAQ